MCVYCIMKKRNIKGGGWPFNLFTKSKDPNAPAPAPAPVSSGFFGNLFKTPLAPGTLTPQPKTGGKRQTKRRSRSNKKNCKSKKRR